jgi:hypothetical protein
MSSSKASIQVEAHFFSPSASPTRAHKARHILPLNFWLELRSLASDLADLSSSPLDRGINAAAMRHTNHLELFSHSTRSMTRKGQRLQTTYAFSGRPCIYEAPSPGLQPDSNFWFVRWSRVRCDCCRRGVASFGLNHRDTAITRARTSANEQVKALSLQDHKGMKRDPRRSNGPLSIRFFFPWRD